MAQSKLVSNQVALLNQLEELLSDEMTCDITIKVAGRPFFAHKVILACRSSTLRAMIFGKFATGERTLDVDHVLPETFQEVLKFLYTGRIAITADNAIELVRAADSFDLEDLRQECAKFLWNIINEKNAFSIWGTANATSCVDVEYACLNFVERNTDCFDSADFVKQPFSILQQIVQSDELCLDELELFNHVVRWGKYQAGDRTNDAKIVSECVAPLMEYIRFPLIDAGKLCSVCESSGVVPQHLLFEAYRHHAAPQFSLSNPRAKPRVGSAMFKWHGTDSRSVTGDSIQFRLYYADHVHVHRWRLRIDHLSDVAWLGVVRSDVLPTFSGEDVLQSDGAWFCATDGRSIHAGAVEQATADRRPLKAGDIVTLEIIDTNRDKAMLAMTVNDGASQIIYSTLLVDIELRPAICITSQASIAVV